MRAWIGGCCRVGVLFLGQAWVIGTVAAQESDSTDVSAAEEASGDLSVGFRGVGEVWQDEFIIHHYRSSRFAGSGFASLGLTPWLSGELELGYMRQSASSARSGVADGYLEMMPIALSMNVRKRMSNSEAFAGLGAAAVVYTESVTGGSVSGTKPGLELRSGVRIHTDFVQPSMWSGSSGGVKRVDIEIVFGRRVHQPFGSVGDCSLEQTMWTGCGFDFSAWRLGLGVVARL